MESPVVVDKPPEYLGNDRGFPFDEEEGSGAWSELAARHPDIAARLRQRPATWARKRRPSSQDATDDFGEGFGGFDRFPFDDIPPEFREHFPSHWNRRFVPREEEPQQSQEHVPQSPPAQQQTTATQTEQEPGPSEPQPQPHLPQYGLRNTVDLGQKSAADPSLVDADERNQRSMSAPPDSCAPPNQSFKMSGQNHQEQHPAHGEQHSNVRHIPIFVEGRDEPVINKSVDHGTHFGETKPTYVPPPQQQPHIDREQYFADDGPVGYHHPPNFSRAFGTPFNKGFRQGPQPFTQQKAYPQAAFTRGASPQRSQSPKPQMHPEDHFVKVPVHHEHNAPKTEPPSRTQQRPPPQQQQQRQAPPQQQRPSPQQHAPQQHAPQQHAPPQHKQPSPQREQTPPQPKQPTPNDPIAQILSIQTDVLNLMTEVENFAGAKNDKKYLFLDEMLTRNLIKLDTIETEGKENIRLARKEAIKCIQKCIAVLEAKAESNAAKRQPQQTQDVEMKENTDAQQAAEQVIENGEVEIKENTKEEGQGEPQVKPESAAAVAPAEEVKTESTVQEEKVEEVAALTENQEATQVQAVDTRPGDNVPEQTENVEQKEEGDDKSPKKGTKNIKKRDKSKDKKDVPNDSDKQETVEDSNKDEKQSEEKKENVDIMQVDDKGDKTEPHVMEVDGAASQ